MARRLEGKVAVITGTGDGQARTAALRFAAEGARIVGCDINEETAAETLRLVHQQGGEMECIYPLDLADEERTHELMEHAAATFGGIDILYNNAMRFHVGTAEQLPLESWNFSLEQVLTIHWLATKHAIPHFRKRGRGSIINIGSVAGLNSGSGFPGNIGPVFAYAVAKAGVLRMTSLLAVELAPLRVRVNAISPGPIRTPMAEPVYGREGASFYEPHLAQLLVDRLGVPDDIVNAALYLASDESSFVTGSNIIIDGGQTACGGAGGPDTGMQQLLDDTLSEYLNVDREWETRGERPQAKLRPRAGRDSRPA
jgi:NAD(P)-dependent dehydrogenase (short-subunit alcohol dehydrogenase family)